jgi:uncharacterized membrane protein
MPHVLKLRVEKDLLWINILGTMLIVVTGLFPTSFIRILIGVPFILFFPGYTLVCALFPRRQELDEIERIALSIGLSIAVVPLIGLMLNYTPFGIRLYPVLVSLFMLMFLMSVAARYRRNGLDVEERFVPSFSVSIPRWGEMNKVDKTLSVGLVAGVIVSGALISNFVATPRVGESFTEFYVLGPTGKVEGYPTNLTLGEESRVILGVINHEYEEVNYSIVIRFDNETIGRIDGIRLQHEERWEQNMTFAPTKVGEKLKLEFLLYANDRPEPYRKLHIWIIVNP